MMIVTGDIFFKPHPLWRARKKQRGKSDAVFDWVREQFLVPGMQKSGIKEQGIDEEAAPLEAYVNHGRWIVKCECGGAEKAFENGLFMCRSCWNAGHRHKYRRVIFPAARVAIESVLEKRPVPNRNWIPGESVTDLERENDEHGAELLEVI
uniref:Uncharacterized protein n=1 Tax=viral metagenome TaxID=1070528 RepID=A0A6M3IXM5_9ZZZZ